MTSGGSGPTFTHLRGHACAMALVFSWAPALALIAACGGATEAGRNVDDNPGDDGRRLLVLAPHPDDEVLIAAGVLRRAARLHESAEVAVMTNGDFTCARDGHLRERETVEALGRVGLSEDAVEFLGYPDAFLAVLGEAPLAPVERRDAAGVCLRGRETYGSRGRARKDGHTARTGSPGLYTSENVTADVAALLSRVAPTDVYVTHGIDAHADHAATYVYFRRAIEALPPRRWLVHRAIVHAGPCWPNGSAARGPCPATPFAPRLGMPPLPDPLGAYRPTERVPVGRGDATASQWKLRVIGTYRSQLEAPLETDWLSSFARTEEVFYPEELVPNDDGDLERPAHGPRQRVAAELTVNGATGVLHWRLATPSGDDGYELVLTGGWELQLRRVGRPGERPLRRFLVPQDGTEHERHRYDVLLDRRDDEGGILEISLRRDGAMFGVGVDVSPPAFPLRARIDAEGAAEGHGESES